MSKRLSDADILTLIVAGRSGLAQRTDLENVIFTDVFIAGSGPIGCTYARTILEKSTTATVVMAEIGSQDSKIIGEHHKNSIKYQKDIDAFVNVIKGALQVISAPPAETYIPTLGGNGWTPSSTDTLIFQGSNPRQQHDTNLKASAVTRTVGGMATHWTCACPIPHDEERVNNPIPKAELDRLLKSSQTLLNVHTDQYDGSIRHRVVKSTLIAALGTERGVRNLPLAVQRRADNPDYVTWTGCDTILGNVVDDKRFMLKPEMRVTRLIRDPTNPGEVWGALVRDLRKDMDIIVVAKAYVIATGAVGVPQILANSGIGGPALGRYLCEQTIAFCQIVLKRQIVDDIRKDPDFAEKVKAHRRSYPRDPLPIPFQDAEPQVMIPYTTKFPYHVQVHRDAFSYGDVGPRADSRIVVDLRFFGKQDIDRENMVYFGAKNQPYSEWQPGIYDMYGMPQATFEVMRSMTDLDRDQAMMNDMTRVANSLGAYLPGSLPQFMEPGLALHITGTHRIGTDPQTSVADPSSKVHGIRNLWVGGNGCIPDSTACNPTLTSVAIALKGAESILIHLGNPDRKAFGWGWPYYNSSRFAWGWPNYKPSQ
ncbi:Pyranose 2-oxidase [Tulasnella sp. JGI-2019a]|nr:Pyranose 2-oxidase [Tulasnella sp. JGI-2019a]KAG9001129.1 Pyranose 2-oxidase [Tulasnella sp. JGI-2019a]KAG9025743.1 Pyranose 2-oxidase [Tulasnella sp. JGI-2019a]